MSSLREEHNCKKEEEITLKRPMCIITIILQIEYDTVVKCDSVPCL